MGTHRSGGFNALVLCQDRLSGEGLTCILREIPGVSAIFLCSSAEQCAAALRRSPIHLAIIDEEASGQWDAVYPGFSRDLAHLRLILIRDPSKPAKDLHLNGHSTSVVQRGPGAGQSLAEAVIQSMDSMPQTTLTTVDGQVADELHKLTQAEQTVLKMLARGLSTKEIAGALFVSPRTVETHRAQITSKLSIRSIAGLTKFAIRAGLATLDD